MQITKIYYNEQCSICNREINYYKTKINNPFIEWVNIHDNIAAYIETKKTKDQLMRRMHAMVDGKLISGAKVFLIIWNEMQGWRILAKVLKQPVLFQFFTIVYEVIALALYLKNKIFN
jgi:predicted DCC family thiol-disulfide oxidoreductase YuxK